LGASRGADMPSTGLEGWQSRPGVVENVSAPANAEPTAASRHVQPTIKLSSYDGSTPLQSHIAKLNNCAKYYSWNSQEKVCHLKNSLEGPASQILWQISDKATEEQVLELLRHHFGHINQAERFRAELSMRKHKPVESVQELYNEIRRLLALSFPGESGGLYDIIGRDAFLAALDDPAMRVKVLEMQPSSMDDALTIVCRLQAYQALNSLDKSAGASPAVDDRKHVRVIKPNNCVALENSSGTSQPITVTFWLHWGCALGRTDMASVLERCNNLPTPKVG